MTEVAVSLLARDLAHCLSPWQLFRDSWDREPDEHQKTILDFPNWKDGSGNHTHECDVLGYRQYAKSVTASVLVTGFAQYTTEWLQREVDVRSVSIVGNSEEQAQKTLAKAKRVFEKSTGGPAASPRMRAAGDSKRYLELPLLGGATIRAYGGHNPDSIVGSTDCFLLLEEADRIPEETHAQTAPFVSAQDGYILRVSVPKEGNYHGTMARSWRSKKSRRVRVPWTPASHISRRVVDKYIVTWGIAKATREYMLMPEGEEWGKGSPVDVRRPRPFAGLCLEDLVDPDAKEMIDDDE